jgi:hypothetical protein
MCAAQPITTDVRYAVTEDVKLVVAQE